MGRTYNMPQVDAPVASLVPENADGAELTPATPVLVIHRGGHVIHDKFDGIDYVIKPGYTTMPFGAALHFQARATVPGTRDENNVDQSYLGIVDYDDPWMCTPMSDEALEAVSRSPEALNRAAMMDPADREVKIIRTPQTGPRRGGGKKPQIAATGISELAKEAAEHVSDKPDTNDAKQDAAAKRRAKGDDE